MRVIWSSFVLCLVSLALFYASDAYPPLATASWIGCTLSFAGAIFGGTLVHLAAVRDRSDSATEPAYGWRPVYRPTANLTQRMEELECWPQDRWIAEDYYGHPPYRHLETTEEEEIEFVGYARVPRKLLRSSVHPRTRVLIGTFLNVVGFVLLAVGFFIPVLAAAEISPTLWELHLLLRSSDFGAHFQVAAAVVGVILAGLGQVLWARSCRIRRGQTVGSRVAASELIS